jgi:hypothetical protein
VTLKLSVDEYVCIVWLTWRIAIVGCICCFITRREHSRLSFQGGKSHVVDMGDRSFEDSAVGELVDKLDVN